MNVQMFALPALAFLPVAAADAISTSTGQPPYIQLVSIIVGGAVSIAGVFVANGRLNRGRHAQDQVDDDRTDELIAELRTQLADAKAEIAELKGKRR